MEVTKNRSGYLVSETHRECTKCHSFFEITSKMTLCGTCNSSRVRSQSPEWRMHQRAKVRSKLKGQEFDLTVEDIIIPERCPILNIPLYRTIGKSGAYNNSPSLDRKDNSKGYVRGNVWVISQLANAMKGAATKEQLLQFSSWITTEFPATE